METRRDAARGRGHARRRLRRDDDGKNDGDDERRNRTGDDGIDDARGPTRDDEMGERRAAHRLSRAVADDPIAATWLRRLRAEGFNVAAHVGPPSRADDEDLPRGVVRASHARHARGARPRVAVASVQSQGVGARACAPKTRATRAFATRARPSRGRCSSPGSRTNPPSRTRWTCSSAARGGNNDDATRDLLSGKLVVVNATPTTPATSQRVGARLAALGVPYVHVAIAGGAREIESGDAHDDRGRGVRRTCRKVPAHVLKRCGVIAAGRNRTRDVVMDECERALRALTQDAPTVVATDDCAACCDLRLVETGTRTIAMRARVRENV